MIIRFWYIAALSAAVLTYPAVGHAQAPADTAARRQQRTLDSLAAVVRALQLRIDSILRARAPGDTGGNSELAALRAAAAAAAADSQPAAAAEQRSLGQNALNPEITVTGDFRASYIRPGPQSGSFDAHEYEFGFQSALDPFATAKIFIAAHDDEIAVEEGYIYFPVLPAHIRLDVGRFRQQVGELNRWHLHAVEGLGYPRVITEFGGEEGLGATGASLYWPVPVPGGLGTWELTVQGTVGSNDVLYAGGSRPALNAQLAGFRQLSRSVFTMASVSGARGTNPDTSLKTDLGVLAARVTWRPPARAREREFTLRGELWALRRRFAGVGPTRHGWYVDASNRLSRRFVAGVRVERLESADAAVAGRTTAVTPFLTFWQSEFVYLRALWEHADTFGVTSDRFTIRAVFAMGPHKHELF